MKTFEFVKYEIEERIIYITLNRPEKRNALNQKVVKELTEAFNFAAQDENGKVIILKANGDVFCAGADLAYIQELQNFSFEDNLDDSTKLKNLFHLIYTHPKVVIAQVEGHAIAGGCGLATVCDFIFSVPDAKFGYTEVKIGFIPALVLVFLLRKIGEARAKRLLLAGDLFTAEELLSTGLFHGLYDKTEIDHVVFAFAQKLCDNNSSISMQLTKEMIANVQSMDLPNALNYAANMNAKARESVDCQKGIAAFLNKDKLSW
ncbi:enoyl-CoA hydratase/isomerase family protein [Chondrinema litorale]|uniref:enoyl-CoA hydratase/isomerase family protein n=1 Tax=Chondrinema litorale TaxID=2994555 RepID=UPI0025429F55|nr:enoyl-CoA hydratase-related protein [Chondrinema litorale]UZR92310.1 enoyl-CoA hydratase-related protein [Chondrinema litorale]